MACDQQQTSSNTSAYNVCCIGQFQPGLQTGVISVVAWHPVSSSPEWQARVIRVRTSIYLVCRVLKAIHITSVIPTGILYTTIINPTMCIGSKGRVRWLLVSGLVNQHQVGVPWFPLTSSLLSFPYCYHPFHCFIPFSLLPHTIVVRYK